MSLNVFNIIQHGSGFYLLFCLYNRGKRSPQRVFIMNLSLVELLIIYSSLCFSIMKTENAIYMTLNVFNIILHGSGFYLLLCLYNRGKRSPQRVFIMNLSLVELLQNICRLSVHITSTLIPSENSSKNSAGSVALWYMILITNSGIYYLCFASMFLLTCDRLLCIWLSVRYPTYWNLKKTFTTIGSTWVFCALIAVTIVLYAYCVVQPWDSVYNNLLSRYITTALFTIFLVFAIFSYSVMFLKFLSSSRNTSTRNKRSKHTILYTFRHSKFFISVMLVSTFLVLMVIPNLINTVLKISGNVDTTIANSLDLCINVCVALSDTADGLIYVFLQAPVKRLLFRKLTIVPQPMCNVDTSKRAMVIKREESTSDLSILHNDERMHDSDGDIVFSYSDHNDGLTNAKYYVASGSVPSAQKKANPLAPAGILQM